MSKEKVILTVNKKDIRIASFCSGFSWVLLIVSVALFVILKEYRFIFTGSAAGSGIIMYYGMKVLREKCCCPYCKTGNMNGTKDREYIANLSAKKDFVVCPSCKKKISIR